MNKFLKFLLIGLLFAAIPTFAEGKIPKSSVGLDSPVFAMVSATPTGEVESLLGLNLGLGFSYRSYFKPLAAESGSAYWEAGTVILLDPYFGVGYDYRASDTLYIGGGVDVFPLNFFMLSDYPGYSIFYSIVPNLHIGIFLF